MARRWRNVSVVATMVAAVASTAPGQTPTATLNASALFLTCSPAIVTIQTASGFGSGVLIDPSGVIVTNLHVIRGETKARVTLANNDVYDDVAVLDVDARKDLVVLKVKGAKLPAVALGDSDGLAIGHTVYAIGTPLGLARTLSSGIVSGVRERDGYRMLQTTAAISPGSSGGALFNDRGEVVGITTSHLEGGQNVNFAVPSNYIRPLLAATTASSLADLAERYPAADASSGNAASVPDPSTSPTLAGTYTALNGNVVVFEQQGKNLDATWSTQQGVAYGHSTFTWDTDRKTFAGTGTITTVCGGSDGRPLEVPITEEIIAVDARTIRDRWTKPVKVDCATRTVSSFTWDEMLWYAAGKQ